MSAQVRTDSNVHSASFEQVALPQRRLSVGYNKAASLVERMEKEGVVGAANHAGKRQILVGGGVDRGAFDMTD